MATVVVNIIHTNMCVYVHTQIWSHSSFLKCIILERTKHAYIFNWADSLTQFSCDLKIFGVLCNRQLSKAHGKKSISSSSRWNWSIVYFSVEPEYHSQNNLLKCFTKKNCTMWKEWGKTPPLTSELPLLFCGFSVWKRLKMTCDTFPVIWVWFMYGHTKWLISKKTKKWFLCGT